MQSSLFLPGSELFSESLGKGGRFGFGVVLQTVKLRTIHDIT